MEYTAAASSKERPYRPSIFDRFTDWVASLPVRAWIFYVGLGVKHGPITDLQRPGLYFIQSLDNYDAMDAGLRMVNAKVRLKQTRLLSISTYDKESESTEDFLGVRRHNIPFKDYEARFHAMNDMPTFASTSMTVSRPV